MYDPIILVRVIAYCMWSIKGVLQIMQKSAIMVNIQWVSYIVIAFNTLLRIDVNMFLAGQVTFCIGGMSVTHISYLSGCRSMWPCHLSGCRNMWPCHLSGCWNMWPCHLSGCWNMWPCHLSGCRNIWPCHLAGYQNIWPCHLAGC